MAAFHIEGYVIVSADGMLANADRVMPAGLKFEGDKQFFTAALDAASLIVHGRHSFEEQPISPIPRRRCGIPRAPRSKRPANTRACAPAPSRSLAGRMCSACSWTATTP